MYDIDSIERHKADIFKKLKSHELTYHDVLKLPINTQDPNKNYAVKKAQAWCESKIALDRLGLESWREIANSPDNYKLIKRIEFSEDSSQYPLELEDKAEDEITIALLDFETTGLSLSHDQVIELGLVILKYSPSKRKIIRIEKVISEYNDPGMEISPEITEITGIKNEDVKGKHIDIDQLSKWLESENTLIIAHNAQFDRPFFHKLVGRDNYKWGCSATEIAWSEYKEYRIESAKLEYILLKLGYFYEGHRASIDCLAMVQMFISLPESLADLVENINKESYYVEATGAPFSVKDDLKALSFRWNADKKVWYKNISSEERNFLLEQLDSLENYNAKQVTIQTVLANDRFKTSL
ncbi:3'-5' exonuclease [Aliikangiella sp. IMCC44632]